MEEKIKNTTTEQPKESPKETSDELSDEKLEKVSGGVIVRL